MLTESSLSTPEEAVQAGTDAGWSHASYCATYRTPLAERLDIPAKYAAHEIEYTVGFNEGVELFHADRYPDGSYIHPYSNE